MMDQVIRWCVLDNAANYAVLCTYNGRLKRVFGFAFNEDKALTDARVRTPNQAL